MVISRLRFLLHSPGVYDYLLQSFLELSFQNPGRKIIGDTDSQLLVFFVILEVLVPSLHRESTDSLSVLCTL